MTAATDSPNAMLPTVLVVDDTPANLGLMGDLLAPHYRVRVANSGPRALAIASAEPLPDIILLDIMMPGMDGYETLQHLQANPVTAPIPVMFVTAMTGDDDEYRGLELGAVDYIPKPVRPAILLARLRTQLELKRARDALLNQNELLEREVARRTRETELVKDVSLHALAQLAEKRDNETGHHLVRTQGYVRALANHLANHPRFAHALSESQRNLIVRAAPLHDIGKVGIPDAILLKPGKLTPDEFEIMKSHAQLGADALADAITKVKLQRANDPDLPQNDRALAFLWVAHDVAQSHHERWDGTGYPRGLSGDEIPVPARLMALADVYDALISNRHYKKAFALHEVDAIIEKGRGTHFDPDVVDAYFALHDQFSAIAKDLADGSEAG
jgi:putative two-component system response regulator